MNRPAAASSAATIAIVLLALATAGQSTGALASPVMAINFTVDAGSSSIGGAGGVPLTGTLQGTFQKFDRLLTLGNGSIVVPAADLSATAAIPTTTILSNAFLSAQVTGSVQTVIPQTLGISPSGSALRNGDNGSGLAWTAQGQGAISGNAVVSVTTLGNTVNTPVTISGLVTPAGSYHTASAQGPVALLDTATGARLTLPVALPFGVSNVQVQAGGAGLQSDFLNALASFMTSYLSDYANGLSPLTGSLAANSATHLPALPQGVSYTVDAARSFLSGGGLSAPLAGTVGGKYLDGDLRFAGESAFGYTAQSGPVTGIASGSVGTGLGTLQFNVDVGSLALDLGFGLGSGYAWDGSSPADLGWLVDHGSVTMSGKVSMHLGPFDVADAPFSLSTHLAIQMQLGDAGQSVSLTRDSGVETLTVPLAFDAVVAALQDTRFEFDAGSLGDLADVFVTVLEPLVENALAGRLEQTTYDGLLVATRGISEGGGPNEVPLAPTTALCLVGLACLWSSSRRMPRDQHHRAAI